MKSEGKSWIWDHAKALGKTLIKMAPDDFSLEFQGGLSSGDDASIRLSCTIHNASEAEAVREIIASLAKTWLTAHREMIREDIYQREPALSFREDLDRMFGTLPAQGSNP